MSPTPCRLDRALARAAPGVRRMLGTAGIALLACAAPLPPALHVADGQAGAASADVTPGYPVRLSGYASRSTESEGVAQRIRARALALGSGDGPPAILVSVENVAVPAAIVERIAADLERELAIPRERFALASTHTHAAPVLLGGIPNMFGRDVPPEHERHIERYTGELVAGVESVARAALARMVPARLGVARGSAGFAANRRTAGGPVDHDLPLLAVEGEDGALLALVFGYACHCTTLGGDFNRVSGDWAGIAAEALEEAHPGVVALPLIGCGADSNPEPRGTLDLALEHGAEVAKEVERLLAAGTEPITPRLRARFATIELAFDRLPTHAEWEALAARDDAVGYHAAKNLARLDRGETLPETLRYPVQTWCFGTDLAQVFLADEVVVDYSLRLKGELDGSRAWITAYTNDVACYVPSERVLAEGGYEGGGAMVYYDQPTRFAPGLEQAIVDEVERQLPDAFRTKLGVDVSRTEGVAPRTPAEALEAFHTHPELAVELVAAEPLVVDPVAIDFGPDGRLWVAEMRDYPEGLHGGYEPGGRISVLEDADGDGRYERRTTFLDGLPFPTGLFLWRGGVLVCAAPDLLYAEDTDGDGRADRVEPLFSGFETGNYQARLNGLARGLDGWIYGACGLFGGTITSSRGGPAVELRGQDFRLLPGEGRIEPAAGSTQQGRVRDDWDDWFGCDNSTLLWHYPLPDHYLRRNPHAPPAAARVLVPAGADPNRLYPTSRLLARFNDPGAAGRTTSACGLGIYRDRVLGDEYAGDAFVCEPVHNLVHREELRRSGATFTSARAASEERSEFLTSDDSWFRPVQVRTGPDGALWVVDMARFVIEHPRWISAERLARLDVRAGDGLGRIWRVVPRSEEARTPARLDVLDGAALARALDTPNGTRRDQVQELLAWRRDPAAVPVLVALAAGSALPEVRAQALSTLACMQALGGDALAGALADPHPGVRRIAVCLSEPLLDREPALGPLLLGLADDPDPALALQLACSLGEWRDARAGDALARILVAHGSDASVRAAAFSSLGPHLDRAVAALLEHEALAGRTVPDPALETTLAGLMEPAVAEPDGDALALLLEHALDLGERGSTLAQLALDEALLGALERQGTSSAELPPAAAERAGRLARAVAPGASALARDPDAPVQARALAARVLLRRPDPLDTDREAVGSLLSAGVPLEVQRAALDGLGRLEDERVAEVLLDAWERSSPALRPAVLDTLLSRGAWTEALVARLESEPAMRGVVDVARRSVLVRRVPRAQALFEVVDRDRERVLERYVRDVGLAGDAARGTEVFERSCSRCHALDGVGQSIGPDLLSVTDRSVPGLLTAILDPNRAIQPAYVEYQLTTTDGRELTGILAGETATGVTLVGADGARVELLRSEIEELRDTRLSLMPEGLESELPPADMADLLAYLRSRGEPARSFPGNHPETVRPDADGELLLLATNGSIHGVSLVFETPFQNLGYWHSPLDRAEWTVEMDRERELDVELEWACAESSAGNTLRIDSDRGALRWTVAGTGGGWDRYERRVIGRLTLPAGRSLVTLRSDGAIDGALVDLRGLRLAPAGD